ncbi:hypothetical protein AB4391_23135, partial [Vibrio lentus]
KRRRAAKLTSEMLSIRQKAMQAWIEKFWEAEYATGKFGEIRGLAKRSQVYHMQALEAEQLGNKEDYEHLIRKAANQGNPDAMYRTGISVLKSSRSDRKLKQSGEEWIVNAANLGHIAAQEFVKKFRLSGFDPKPAAHDKSKEKVKPLNQESLLREKADKGDALAMCLYGNTLIPSRREFDKRKGLEYLTKASNQAPSECKPRLWEAYDLALNSNSIDMA